MLGSGRGRRGRGVDAATALVGALLLAGCAAGPDADAAGRAAAAFTSAAAAGDGSAACALAADAAREAVEESTGASCAEGITRVGIAALAPDDVVVRGRAAVVRSGGAAVFLALSADGWRVRAAGCAPSEDGPYECAVDGS